ncbi:unnamed protein product [Rotaria sordida]|uniref:VLIG-type G domain-containing protein n=1 Tax=Rotaria sordida TaxID=392033 RepID=A0A814KE68_9BILA|nr:unnamed protein product [Rotaria sordida]CAF3822723.1 unnamed protein product [Rotaria sordida]
MSNEKKKCIKCDRVVHPSNELLCFDKLWHRACFACEICDVSLSPDVVQTEDQQTLYCATHFAESIQVDNVNDQSSFNNNDGDSIVTSGEEERNDLNYPLPRNTEPTTKSSSELDASKSELSNRSAEGVLIITPETWSIEQVAQWLSSIGLKEVTEQFGTRTGKKAIRPAPNNNVSSTNNRPNLTYLLQDANCIHSEDIHAEYFSADDYELLKNWSLCLCFSKTVKESTELDQVFNTLVDKTMNAQVLVEELVKNDSLKVYVVDSLKRYHSLMDIIHILPTCPKLDLTRFPQQHQATVEKFINTIDTITKSVLLTTTIDSMSYESQRYFGNFIKKNDLPVPFAYYMWNKQKKFVEYKINFNLLAEIMCLTTGPYILQVGSESAMRMGKTSLLQYIFPDKRAEALNTDGSSTLRNGCIDVLFPSDAANQKNETYAIFDVHGIINALNEDIITSIQENCALQIFYVTEQDLKSTFLNSMMNYSRNIQEKPTMVVVFDPNYDDKRHTEKNLIHSFQTQYQSWKCVKWITAPPAKMWYQMDSNKKNKDLARSQRLLQSFKSTIEDVEEKIQQQVHCTTIFSIQYYYLNVKASKNYSPPVNHRFEIQDRLNELFHNLNEKTENLRITTPVSYLSSAIKQCERELSNNWDAPQMKVQSRRDDLIRQRSNITTINRYTAFFINLLTKCSYIEILMTEKYLEKWRAQFESILHEQSRKAKNEASQFSSSVKQLEERLEPKENISEADKIALQQALHDAQSKFNEQRKLVTEVDTKLMNIDLTIGLFCDEIMALYELSPTLFNPESLIQDIAKMLANLMLKGFAIHILRSRPLHCHSNLIKKIINFIPTTQQPPLILTVIGEQSSAKSSLMNATFGCNFRISAGRCTIGMYMSVIQWKSKTIVIFDTEGLLSLEEAGSIFDNQMVTMAVLSSHLVLVNHKGEFNAKLKDLIGMSFYAKLQIRSPIKPKLLFVLRDQVDLLSKTIFFRQLTELTEQLQNDSKFLKISIDEELDIHNENVYLLPNAFSHEEHGISSVAQCWRNQTFSREIITLRNIIFNNITSTTKPRRFQLNKSISPITTSTAELVYPVSPINDSAYTDMRHLYEKISSNWEAIDLLGPRLLECKTLHELSIMKELEMIANNIIKTTNATVYQDGEKLIDEKLLSSSRKDFIDKNRDRIIEDFNHQLNTIITLAINQAQKSFNGKTERSCYLPEMKQKVSKSMEPPILSAQHLLKEMFEERLTDLLRKTRVDDAQKQLLKSVQNEFDQNKNLQLDYFKNQLEKDFRRITEQYQKDLESSFETEATIIEKILQFYNSQLLCKQAEAKEENFYHLLFRINDQTQYKSHFEKFENCLSIIRRCPTHQTTTTLGDVWRTITSLFKKPSDEYIDSLWTTLKNRLKWFTYNNKEQKNKKIFTEIWNVVLRTFEEELLNLINDTTSFSSNPKTIQHLFQLIENAMSSQCITSNVKFLEKHTLCSDVAIIGLNIIITEAINKEKSNYNLNLENSTNEIKECKENLLKQCVAMKNAFELGQTLAETIGKQIINDIGLLLNRRIEKEMTEDIVKSQFIKHKAIQQQAYQESIIEANGENILKYVYNINRYFIELSLREIKTTLNAVTHKHTCNLQNLITLTIDKVDQFVQKCNHDDTARLRDDIRKEILELPDLKLGETAYIEILQIFSMSNIVRMPIKDKERFRKGFSNIRDYYKDIGKKVTDLTKNMKAKAFRSCKQSITQKLGCQARCPGCGAKCSKPEPHDNEEVEVWQDPCKSCPKDNCTCEHPKPISVKTHEASHHLACAFSGLRIYKLNTPWLDLCYQRWTTSDVCIKKNHRSDDSEDDDDWERISPRAKYYNKHHPTWYNDLTRLSTEGDGCQESIPPLDQRRAWMVVRHAIIKHSDGKMIDEKEYDNKLYPLNIESLPADFEPKWNDESLD